MTKKKQDGLSALLEVMEEHHDVKDLLRDEWEASFLPGIMKMLESSFPEMSGGILLWFRAELIEARRGEVHLLLESL